MSTALIIVIVLAVLAATGLGGCLICMCAAGHAARTATGTAPTSTTPGNTSPSGPTENWITSEHPYVKFLAPPGWSRQNTRSDWGVFRSPDNKAVFAFTTFNQPGESTVRLGAAAGVLGVGEVAWRSPEFGNIGRDNFPARMGEGSCNFEGPNGYMWYATVNPGGSDQILLIYTVSASGTKAHKDAALTAIKSLQRR